MPKDGGSEPAAQHSHRGRREICDRRMPTGHEMLEIFEDAGVQPKSTNNRDRTSTRPVTRHPDCRRPGISDGMFELPRQAGAHHLFGRHQGQHGKDNHATPGKDPERHHGDAVQSGVHATPHSGTVARTGEFIKCHRGGARNIDRGQRAARRNACDIIAVLAHQAAGASSFRAEHDCDPIAEIEF